ncbi:MAG: mannitol dehydrogenase family protein [Gammaproteobacteria bacterium]|nr:MAG: mannitol dehydrogenase family protein [Gammaproteobacteria bacterium]
MSMSARLRAELLAALPGHIQRPVYDRQQHGVGIVHLGIGAFHRAHQAAILDDVLARTGGNWRSVGISCRSRTVREHLVPQDCLYTVVERASEGERLRIIGTVADVLVAPDDPAAAIAVMARAATHIISLTVTEKGYCRDAAGGLNTEHPDIAHDLAAPSTPRTAVGLLTEALRQRRLRGATALTLLSCDNLPQNGRVLKRVLLDFASRTDPATADWIERELACPSTVVDRIVPATTPEDIAAVAEVLGCCDDAVVVTEPFSRWTIEDRFGGPRPRFEVAGAQLVSDVRPFELAKLRLLNGSHSTLAYLGSLAGFRFVHEVIADRDFRALVQHLLRAELAPTVPAAPGLDLQAYQAALLRRFANPALRHQLSQIAMDGSQKLPQRLLEPAQSLLERGLPFDGLALAIAGWIRYALGRDESGGRYVVDDPLAGRLAAIADLRGADAEQFVGALLELSEVFGEPLRNHPAFRAALARQLQSLLVRGARATVRALVQQLSG